MNIAEAAVARAIEMVEGTEPPLRVERIAAQIRRLGRADMATRLTPATPEMLALYRTDHVIVPVDGHNDAGFERQVCQIDGIEIIRRGFSGYLHDPRTIRRLARIERGEPEYV